MHSPRACKPRQTGAKAGAGLKATPTFSKGVKAEGKGTR